VGDKHCILLCVAALGSLREWVKTENSGSRQIILKGMSSFGWFPGVWFITADVSEHSICSNFIGRRFEVLPSAYEDGTDRVFGKSAIINQTPGNHPKEDILYSEHGKSLKSRILKGFAAQYISVSTLYTTNNSLQYSFVSTLHIPLTVHSRTQIPALHLLTNNSLHYSFLWAHCICC
jgi:hypothetical protein